MFKVIKKFKMRRIIFVQSTRLINVYNYKKSQKRQARMNYDTLKRKH